MNEQLAKQTNPSLLENTVLWREESHGLDQDWIDYSANGRGDPCIGLYGCTTAPSCFVWEDSKEFLKANSAYGTIQVCHFIAGSL